MRSVALAEVLRAPGRSLLRALAVGGALSLILLFEGFRLGIDRQMAEQASRLPADLIVAERGVGHFVGLRSTLPQATRSAVEAVPGIRATHPLLTLPVILVHGGQRTPLQLVVFDDAGAPALAKGRPLDGPRQVVLDQRLARLHRLRVGDTVDLLDRELRVVGLSAGTDVSFVPLAFLSYDELLDILLESAVPGGLGGAPVVSFLLVDLRRGSSVEAARRAILEALPEVAVYTPQELASNDVDLGRQLFGPVLGILRGVARLAAVLAVGLVMSAAVIDRRRELGILKALGATTAALAFSLVTEALLIGALAYPLALLLARGAAAAVEAVQPLYRVVPWEPAVLLAAALATVAAAVLGALVPLRTVARLEADAVFRS